MMPLNAPDVDLLLDWLRSEDASQRREAAIALARHKDARLIEPLLAALSDEDATVRANAAAGLGENRAEAARDVLIDRLRRDPHELVRERAATALAQIGGEAALLALLDATDDPATFTRNRVLYVLGASRDPRAVEPLIEALDHAEVSTQGVAAWALGAVGDPRAFDPLTGLLSVTAPELRGNAAWALGELADARAIPLLLPLLADPVPEVRGKVAWALGALGELSGETGVVPELIRLLEDFSEVRGEASHVFVSQYAAEGLLQIGTDKARAAVEAWRPIAAERLLPYRLRDLIGALARRDNDVLAQVIAQLVEIGPAALPELHEALRSHRSPRVRQGVARALAELGAPQSIHVLLMALSDSDAGVWSQATAALARLGKAVRDDLLVALRSEKQRVRQGAALALWRSHREEAAFKPLLTALNDDEMLVRSSAITSLWQQPDERALATLQIRLNEEDGMLQRYIAQALQALGTPAAQATLAHWLRGQKS